MALLRFENLSADPSLDWIATAAPAILAADLRGNAHTLPLTVDTMRDARLENAGQIVHGYYDLRGGKLHFEVAVESPERHKMVTEASVEGSPLAALNSVAGKIGGANAFSTVSEQAVSAWGRGDYEAAVGLDPDFGAAWLAWAEKLRASGDAHGALDVAGRALMRTGLRSATERARIELLAAVLSRNDAERRAALTKLSQLEPADPTPRRTLAELEMNARNFAAAARAYRDAIQAGDNAPGIENLLGYAEALAGNMDAAREAFQAYGRQPEQSTNALDSLGEGYFINGKFEDAEKAFLGAYAKDPAFLNGATLWKAAHARWLKGDLKGADALLDRYWESRAKAHDALAAWRRANWLYATGRPEQAVMLLKESPPQTREIAQKQIAVWNDPAGLPNDLAALQQAYEKSDPVHDGLVRTFYADALLRAGHKEEARMLATRWPLPELSDNLLQSLLFPRYLALRKAIQ